MQTLEPAAYRSIKEFFPMDQPREKQLKVLEFIDRAYQLGYRDIVVAAPTGIGKSGIGVAACEWGRYVAVEGQPGGYYLVTQKMLQNQLTEDFATGKFKGTGTSIKSATEYPCPTFKNCGFASRCKRRCPMKIEEACSYTRQKNLFLASTTGITNYSYLFAEHKYAGNLPKRKVIVVDETHNLERELLRFNDIKVNDTLFERWKLNIDGIPQLTSLQEFVQWLTEIYEPAVSERTKVLLALANEDSNDAFAKDAVDLDQHMCKLHRSMELMKNQPDNWIFWSEQDRNKVVDYIARPLDASAYKPELIDDMGSIRIYMSAYPGPKEVFCRSLGLDPKKVAWIGLSSTFKPENRPIVMGCVGSMSRRNVDATLPSFLRVVNAIFKSHRDAKGVIHCNSYKLGEAIVNHFKNTEFGPRLLFPRNSEEREPLYRRHRQTSDPTILVSPSMTEGFDFIGDLATWQIIAKVPFPSLSDKQVVAKKDQDEDWYALETIKVVIQACGRVCRADDDKGTTYILDSDFKMLWERYQDYFPKWWQEAVVWPKSKSYAS